MTATYDDVKFRIADIEANIGTGSDSIVTEAISGAISEVAQYCGASATGDAIDTIVADLAAKQMVDRAMGMDPMTRSPKLVILSENLEKNAMRKIKGFGVVTRYDKTND